MKFRLVVSVLEIIVDVNPAEVSSMASLHNTHSNGEVIDTVLRVEVLSDWEGVFQIEKAWDGLFVDAAYSTVYSTLHFCHCTWKYINDPQMEPYIVAVFDQANSELVAVFPMCLQQRKKFQCSYVAIIPIASDESDKVYPLIKVGYEAVAWIEFARILTERQSDWDVLHWRELSDGMVGRSILKNNLNHGCTRVETSQGGDGPLVDLTLDWEDFLNKHKRFRRALRRINRQLEGGVYLKVFQSCAEIQKALRIYVEIESKSWKKGRIGLSKSEQCLDFYQDVFLLMAEKKQICMGILYHGDKAISAEISYLAKDRVFFSHGTYDPDYASYSPGKISTGLFIKEHLGGQYLEGDFLAGFASYLVPWSSSIQTTTDVKIYNLRKSLVAIIWFRWQSKKTAKWILEKGSKLPPKLLLRRRKALNRSDQVRSR